MQTQNKTIISQIMGKPPQRVVCPQHGPYYAFTTTLFNGEKHSSRCPRCVEEDELAQQRLMSRETASSIIANRLSSAGVPDDLAFITFESMPLGLRQNTELVRACTKLADGAITSLVLLGGNGVGKTTLAIATLARIVEKSLMDDMPVSIHYTTETQLLRALKTTFSRKDGPTEQDIINRMSKVDERQRVQSYRPAGDHRRQAPEQADNHLWESRSQGVQGPSDRVLTLQVGRERAEL